MKKPPFTTLSAEQRGVQDHNSTFTMGGGIITKEVSDASV